MTTNRPSSTTTFSPTTKDIWSPSTYGERYVQERTRPGLELIERALYAASLNPSTRVKRVVDLGCGTGRFIPGLLNGWKGEIEVVGIDSSKAMLDKAESWVKEELRKEGKEEWVKQVSYKLDNIVTYTASPPVDLIFTNAALQWLPDHATLIPHLFQQLSPSGILAIQIPNDFHRPAHTLMHSIAKSYTDSQRIPSTILPRLERHSAWVNPLSSYYDQLRPVSEWLDCWETTYYHSIRCEVGDHPVARFLEGSSLNYWLNEMPEEMRTEMRAEYVRGVEKEYPSYKVVGEGGKEEVECCFPFNRYFIVAVKK